MGNDISPENLPTGSSPEPVYAIKCYDPENPSQPCPVCNGLGMVRYNVPVDDERFGKIFRCPNNPVEKDTSHIDRLRDLSNLGAYANKQFEDFEINPVYEPREKESLQRALNTTVKYAENPAGWLVLEGPYGCGKTHLAAATGNVRLLKGDRVLFITVPDLLDHLRQAYAPNAEVTYDELFNRVRDVPILILDDLGVENPSEWAQEKLFQLLNYRHSNLRSTIITTNVNLNQLDPRIRSRLLDDQIVHRVTISAPDYRTPHRFENAVASELSMYRDMRFESFDTGVNLTAEEQRNLRRALDVARSYAQHPDGWLVFTGGYGCGKTHLAAAIAQQRQASGDDVLFVTVPNLLDHLRMTFAPDSNVRYDRVFQQVKNVPLLVLDDIGLESASPWAKEKLFQLIDHRYLGQQKTVMTSSKQIENLDDRLVSRLLDRRRCTIFAITAPAYARRMQRR